MAAADKQDSSGKQYCKIHRTRGHDLQNCLLSNRKLSTSGTTRRKPRKELVDPARNVPAEEDAAARSSSGKEIDLPAPRQG